MRASCSTSDTVWHTTSRNINISCGIPDYQWLLLFLFGLLPSVGSTTGSKLRIKYLAIVLCRMCFLSQLVLKLEATGLQDCSTDHQASTTLLVVMYGLYHAV